MSRLIRRVFFLGCVGVIFFLGLTLAAIQFSLNDLPDLDKMSDYRPALVTRVFDAEGHLFAEFFEEKRTFIPIEQIPEHVKNAFIAAEDADFYTHKGIAYFGILRAILGEIKYYLVGGQRVGGSTITQQTAKTMLLSPKRTYTRKLKEFFLAKRIEEKFTKPEILNLYLNQIYFGNGVYGIEEAAQKYYSVKAANLSIGQAAALASVPKSPNRINPLANPEHVKVRKAYVLRQMLDLNLIKHEQYKHAIKESVAATNKSINFVGKAPHYAEEVRRQLISQFGEELVLRGGLKVYTAMNVDMQEKAAESLRSGLREIDKREGYRGPNLRFTPPELKEFRGKIEKARKNIFSAKSTHELVWDLSQIDKDITGDTIEAITHAISPRPLKRGMIVAGQVTKISPKTFEAEVDLGTKHAHLFANSMSWVKRSQPLSVLMPGDIILVKVESTDPKLVVTLEQIPIVEGAFAAIDPKTHQVLAQIGSYDFYRSNFNRATQAKRQAGSALKPLVYSLAIEKERVTPATIITDAPRVYFEASQDGAWRPKNATQKYLGDITVRRCLVNSVNTCSIALLEATGIDALHTLAASVNLLTKETPFAYDLTIALGSSAITPISLFNAFTIFPNLGTYADPIFITKVEAQNGEVLFESKVEERQVMRPETAFVMTNMMRGFFGQPSIAPQISGIKHPIAGKTGTSNGPRDLWFIGFSPSLVAGAWVGYDDNTPLGNAEWGSKAAFPIWRDFMTKISDQIPVKEFIEPEGITWKSIDARTGRLAANVSTFNESSTETLSEGIIREAFITGTEPKQVTADRPLTPFELHDVGGLAP